MKNVRKILHSLRVAFKGKKRYIFLFLMILSVQFGYKYVIAEVFTDISQETVNYCEKKYDGKEFTFVRYEEDEATPYQQVMILSDGTNEFKVTRLYDVKNNIIYRENYVLFSCLDTINEVVAPYVPKDCTYSINVEDSHASCLESPSIGSGSVLKDSGTVICIDTIDGHDWTDEELNNFVEGVTPNFRFYINHRRTSESEVYRKDIINAKGDLKCVFPNS